MNVLAVLVACGKEEEVASGTDSAFLTLGSYPMLIHSLRTFQDAPSVEGVVVAVSKERLDATVQLVKRYGCTKVCGIVVGGVNRMGTLRTVFAKMPGSPSIVMLHEASRPFISKSVVEEVVKAAKRYGCAIAAHRIPDGVKVAPNGVKVAQTLERNTVWTALTPQAFKTDVLEKIIDPKHKAVKLQDDESEFVRKPAEVHMVEAGPRNIKIRSSADLAVASALLNSNLI